MKNNNFKDGVRFFIKGLKLCKTEVLISLQVIVVITLFLSIILYLIEHYAQPDVYSSFWKNLAWSFVTFLDDPPPSVIVHSPTTAAGQFLWAIICLLKIAIFAIPTGLIANGFSEAMEEDKRDKHLENLRSKLTNAFSRTLARSINTYRSEKDTAVQNWYIAPRYESLARLQVNYLMDTKDVLEVCQKFPEFRLGNMASIQTAEETPIDRLIVLHSMHMLHNANNLVVRNYGYYINRESKITIVATTAHTELSIEWFSYYLAMFGGFNYICRNRLIDPENNTSYFNMENNTDDEDQETFYNDLKTLSQGEDKWNIYLLQHISNMSDKNVNHIHFSSSQKGGNNSTITKQEEYTKLKQAIAEMMNEYDINAHSEDSSRYPLTQKNVTYRLYNDDVKCNAFSMRIGAHIMIKNKNRDIITYRIAETIGQSLSPEKGMTEEDCNDLCCKKRVRLNEQSNMVK